MLKAVIRFFIKLFATGLGVGYSPLMPGTIGSLWGVWIYYSFHYIGLPHAWYYFFTLSLTLFAIFIAHFAEKIFGEKDCQKIVIDEVAGQLVTYLFIPYSWLGLVLGFVFFRIFDMLKVFPANWVQKKVPGGSGVVGDDLVAAIQAGVMFYISFFWRT